MSRIIWLCVIFGALATSVVARAPASAAPQAPAGGKTTSAAGRLLAGAASVAIDVPAGTPLAGYGAVGRRLLVPDVLGRHPHAFWFRPHVGVHEPPRARALVLDGGTTRVVWIAVDLVAVDRGFTEAVRRRLGGDPRVTLLISASHSHSGPGAFIDSALMGFVAVDRLDTEVREAIVAAVVDAAVRADRAKTPARAGTLVTAGPALTRGRLGEPVDRELAVLKVAREDGRPIALVWNYAIHGTMLGARNLALSGDVMGIASAALERSLGVPALFVNGAVGDVSPRGHGLDAARASAAALASSVEGAWRRIDARDVTPPAAETATAALPGASLPLRSCLGRWVPPSLGVPLGGAFPRDAGLVAVAMGETAWVTVPGELQSSLGMTIKRGARGAFPHAFVAGVTNDYLGYFVAASDGDRVSYVTCASLYGPGAGECLVETAGMLVDRLSAARRRGGERARTSSGRRCSGG